MIGRRPSKSWLKLLALEQRNLFLKLTENKMGTQKNNTEKCHQRGLESRIANYQTQQTIRTMENSPAKIEARKRHIFFVNALVMLNVVEYV